MTPHQLIDAEIDRLAAEHQRLWNADCPSRDVQLVALHAMMEALRWAKSPQPGSDRFFTPFDRYCQHWQRPEPVLVPTPTPADYVGTPLEGFKPT